MNEAFSRIEYKKNLWQIYLEFNVWFRVSGIVYAVFLKKFIGMFQFKFVSLQLITIVAVSPGMHQMFESGTLWRAGLRGYLEMLFQ